ncbi:MAG: hypothetical protein Q9219_005978 [cf. Caloplaca sp. 3 TL-2023]
MAPVGKNLTNENPRLSSILGAIPKSDSLIHENFFRSRLTGHLAFAAKLESILLESIDGLPSLTASLYRNIETINQVRGGIAAPESTELEERGTSIWNLTSKHKNNGRYPERAHNSSKRRTNTQDNAESIEMVSRQERNQLGVAEQVIERAAFYDQRLQRLMRNHATQHTTLTTYRLTAQYYILRVILAWRRERLDLADFFLTKFNSEKSPVDAALTEELTDVMFEIGRDQTAKKSYGSAIRWLEGARANLISPNPDCLGTDAGVLRSCIAHTLVHALLGQRCEESNRRAWVIIQELANEAENTLAVLLLKLQVLTINENSTQDYFDVLVQIIRQIHLSDINLKTILHHIHKIRVRSTHLAHTALTVLLSDQLLATGETAWLEKTLITILWNGTTSTELEDFTDQLEELLDQITAKSNFTLSTSATHAAQILILRRVEALYSREEFGQADAWCRLALHGVFCHSGLSNSGKLQRITARLLIEELDTQKPQDHSCINEICKVFEAGAAALKTSQRQGSTKKNEFPSGELEWFSRNSYNLALKFNNVQSADDASEQASDRFLRQLFCGFLGCCLLVVLARAEDVTEKQSLAYPQL